MMSYSSKTGSLLLILSRMNKSTIEGNEKRKDFVKLVYITTREIPYVWDLLEDTNGIYDECKEQLVAEFLVSN